MQPPDPDQGGPGDHCAGRPGFRRCHEKYPPLSSAMFRRLVLEVDISRRQPFDATTRKQKKPPWWNTPRYSTTPAYSSTGAPTGAGCPSSSRPTTSDIESCFDSQVRKSLALLQDSSYSTAAEIASELFALSYDFPRMAGCPKMLAPPHLRTDVSNLLASYLRKNIGRQTEFGVVMSHCTHCQQCGRRLRDAIFCRRCGQFLCSGPCLDEHAENHLRTTSTPQGPVETAALDSPLSRVRGITFGRPSVAGRIGPTSSS